MTAAFVIIYTLSDKQILNFTGSGIRDIIIEQALISSRSEVKIERDYYGNRKFQVFSA